MYTKVYYSKIPKYSNKIIKKVHQFKMFNTKSFHKSSTKKKKKYLHFYQKLIIFLMNQKKYINLNNISTLILTPIFIQILILLSTLKTLLNLFN